MESTAVNTTDVQGDTMQYYDAERHEQIAKGLPTTSRDRLHNELIKTVLDLEQVKEDLNSVFSENKESSVSTIRGSSTLEPDKEPPIESDLASPDQAKQVSKDDTVTSFPPDFTPGDLATQPDSARVDLVSIDVELCGLCILDQRTTLTFANNLIFRSTGFG